MKRSTLVLLGTVAISLSAAGLVAVNAKPTPGFPAVSELIR